MLMVHPSPLRINSVTSITSAYPTDNTNTERDSYRIIPSQVNKLYIALYKKPANLLSLFQPIIHVKLKIDHWYTELMGFVPR